MQNWEKAERKDPKKFHTQAQPVSGRRDHSPTDSTSDLFSIDTKYTDKKSFSVSKETWNKLCEENAILNAKDGKNRVPLLSVHVQDLELVVLEYQDFANLVEVESQQLPLQPLS